MGLEVGIKAFCLTNISSKYIPVIEIKIYNLFILKTLKYPKYAIDKVTLTYIFFGGMEVLSMSFLSKLLKLMR